MEIISRAEAKAEGLKRYFTGKPCKHGHVVERHVNGGCVACDLIKSAAQKKANPEKTRAANAKWRKANPKKVRAAGRKCAYGLTPEDFNALMDLQKHACVYCSRPLIDGALDYRDKPYVDHDHATGEVRMILCTRCNVAFGRFGDNTAGLEKAIALLKDPPYSRMKLAQRSAHKHDTDQPLTAINQCNVS